MDKLPLWGKNQPNYKNMWDGFWIRDFDNSNLLLSCSFDKLLYRNYDFVFEGVSFFNIPNEWHDTFFDGESPFREASEAEFLFDFEDEQVNLTHKKIYAIELYFRNYPDNSYLQHCFYIVANNAYAFECTKGNAETDRFYKDPVDKYLSKENRVKYFKV